MQNASLYITDNLTLDAIALQLLESHYRPMLYAIGNARIEITVLSAQETATTIDVFLQLHSIWLNSLEAFLQKRIQYVIPYLKTLASKAASQADTKPTVIGKTITLSEIEADNREIMKQWRLFKRNVEFYTGSNAYFGFHPLYKIITAIHDGMEELEEIENNILFNELQSVQKNHNANG